MLYHTYKIAYEELDVTGFMQRYHFDKQDLEMVQAAMRFLSEITQVEVWILDKKSGVLCAATLGRRYDELEALVAESGNLFLSYCMECIGMEFLSKGYEKINETVQEQKGLWLSKFSFLDEENMAEKEVQELFCMVLSESGKMEREGVEWKNGMLKPLKSVIFRAEYRNQKEEGVCTDCSGCENITCSFRKFMTRKNKLYENVDNRKRSAKAYSYGVTTIFGGGKE